MDPYKPPEILDGEVAEAAISAEEADRIAMRLSKFNGLSFAFGLPGLALQFGAREIGLATGSTQTAALASVTGQALFVIGLGFYAALRGRKWPWAGLGLLSCVGLLVLYFMPKYCLNCVSRASYKVRTCERCGGPLGA